MAILSSLTELRSECRQNSPKTDDVSCKWDEYVTCTRFLLNAAMAVILSLGERESLGIKHTNTLHNSPTSEHFQSVSEECS